MSIPPDDHTRINRLEQAVVDLVHTISRMGTDADGHFGYPSTGQSLIKILDLLERTQ